MKLQRIVSRKIGGKTYYKWQVTLSPEDVERLGWSPGEEIEANVKGQELRLRREGYEKV